MVDREPARATRRTALQTLGTLGALTGGFVEMAEPARASDHVWREDNADYGRYDITGCDCWAVFDLDAELIYDGYDPDTEDDVIGHQFTFALVGHTYEQEQSGYYEYYPAAADPEQDGNQFTVENPNGTEAMNLDRTYPGYVTSDTSPDWATVVKDDTESWDTYEQEVQNEVDEDSNAGDVAADLIALAASSVLGAVAGSGVGAAASLAYLMFDSAGNQTSSCGTQTLYDPDGFHWDFCNDSGYDTVVPINLHHVDIEIRVPWDGGTYSATINQEAHLYDNESYLLDRYGTDNAFSWDVELPGYKSNASLTNQSTYRAYD